MLGSVPGRYPSANTVRADEKPISGRERLGSADLTAAAFASDGPLASLWSVLAARKRGPAAELWIILDLTSTGADIGADKSAHVVRGSMFYT